MISRRPFASLVSDYVFFSLCSNHTLNGLARWAMKYRISTKTMEILLKPFLFNKFYGGETIEQCKIIGSKLCEDYKLGLIIDGSKEYVGEESALRQNTIEKVSSIRTSALYFGNQCRFVPVKVTSVIHHGVLTAMASLLKEQQKSIWNSTDPLRDMQRDMDHNTIDKLTIGLDNLRLICDEAAKFNIAVLLDAEDSDLQPAIEMIYRIILLEYANQPSTRPTIFNTYQVYLKRTETILQRDLDFFHKANLPFAIKLVRGAYMKTEVERAIRMNKENPLQESKEETDRVYNKIALNIVSEIAVNQKQIQAMFATHNLQTIADVTKAMNSFNITNNNSAIHFGQILGMADQLSRELGRNGFNCSKLILFGKFDDLLPWLMRRLDENKVCRAQYIHHYVFTN